MRNITNPLIDAWEAAGLQALPMGLQAILLADAVYSIKKAGREESLMNAAGQISGLMHQGRPAPEIFNSMVNRAVDILARRIPTTVTAVP